VRDRTLDSSPSSLNPFGVNPLDAEQFFVQEGTLLLLATGFLVFANWFSPRPVPDRVSRGIERSRVWTPVAMVVIAAGGVVLPVRNLLSSLGPAEVKKPRFIPKEVKERRRKGRPSRPAWEAERAVVNQSDGNPLVAVAQFSKLRAALQKDPMNLRLYDYLAALTVMNNLDGERRGLIAEARSKFKDAAGFSVDDQPLPPTEPRLPSRPASSGPTRPPKGDSLLRRILVGGRVQVHSGSLRTGPGRCRRGTWKPHDHRRRPAAFETLLAKRVARWEDPNSRWRASWVEGGKRQKEGWQLPDTARQPANPRVCSAPR
jgi:hypothetical protein